MQGRQVLVGGVDDEGPLQVALEGQPHRLLYKQRVLIGRQVGLHLSQQGDDRAVVLLGGPIECLCLVPPVLVEHLNVVQVVDQGEEAGDQVRPRLDPPLDDNLVEVPEQRA